MLPLVSAIITTHNRASLLERAIESVLQQTFREFELFVLDNSSTDDTAQVVRRYQDRRLRYIRHEPMSVGAARNLGLQYAAARYTAFLDDDDEWLPEKLHWQLEAFSATLIDTALVYGGFHRVDDAGSILQTHVPSLRGRILTGLLWQRDPFTGSASNPMLRTDVVRRLGGYNSALRASEDWELYLRLAEEFSVEFTPKVVVKIRSHRGPRLGDRVADACAVEEMVLGRYTEIMTPRLRSYYLQKIGGKLCRTGAMHAGRRRLRSAIAAYPLNLIAYAQYGLSYFGSRFYARAHRFVRRFIAS